MNRALVFVMLLVVVVLFFVASGQNSASETAANPSTMLPAKLDSLYPPIAKSPVYLEEMISLSNSLIGIMIDFQQNDIANATHHFDLFKAQYQKCSELVPEWKRKYSFDYVDALGEALKSSDHEAFMGAARMVGENCHACHVQHMSDVQYKYHWFDFGDLVITDPVLMKDLPYAQFMMFTVTSMLGIRIDLEEGQTENAREQAAQFAARFETLTESCELCHSDSRHYFVDNSIQEVVKDLQAALEAEPVDTQLMRASLQTIEVESCYKCHLLHIPATYAKARWRSEASH